MSRAKNLEGAPENDDKNQRLETCPGQPAQSHVRDTRYEYGVKAGFVTAARTNWVLGAKTLPGNPYDGKTLTEVLAQAKELCGVKAEQACCDLGYRGHGYKGDCDIQVVNRFRKRKPRAILRWWKRRSAIEPVIGHIKSDHYMERNRLGGRLGDTLNTIFAGLGFNLVKLMKRLARLFLRLRAELGGFAEFLLFAASIVARGLTPQRIPMAVQCWNPQAEKLALA